MRKLLVVLLAAASCACRQPKGPVLPDSKDTFVVQMPYGRRVVVRPVRYGAVCLFIAVEDTSGSVALVTTTGNTCPDGH